MFQADGHHPEVDLQHLDGLVERASSGSQTQGIGIDKMVTTLRSRRMNQPNTQWVWIITVIIASIACGAVWPVWVKLFNKCCPGIREYITRVFQPPLTPGNTRLHECEIGLQVNLEEEAPGVQPGETTESSIPLSGFVQHGVMTGDRG